MQTSLAQKLQLKPDQLLLVLNLPAAYRDALATALPGVTLHTTTPAPAPAVLLFVNNLADTQQWLPEVLQLVNSDTLLWLAYPKGSSGIQTDINRDRLWQAVRPTGWQGVRQVALDAVWSALRFRPADKVGC